MTFYSILAGGKFLSLSISTIIPGLAEHEAQTGVFHERRDLVHGYLIILSQDPAEGQHRPAGFRYGISTFYRTTKVVTIIFALIPIQEYQKVVQILLRCLANLVILVSFRKLQKNSGLNVCSEAAHIQTANSY
jgi:hypothetical protein